MTDEMQYVEGLGSLPADVPRRLDGGCEELVLQPCAAGGISRHRYLCPQSRQYRRNQRRGMATG